MRAWKGMPPVKGIRIDLSNNHTVLNAKGQRVPFFDMCDELQGVYPKDFKFTGWHPFCRCFAVPITASWDEIEAMWEAENRGKDISDYHFKDEVADMPKAFTDWIKKNEGRIEKAKNMPYFIRDNYKGGEVGNGLRWMPEKPAAANGGSVPADKSIQSGGEEKDELSKLAKAVGVDLGAPMAHEQADMKHPNPHYSEAEEYRVNCQSAVVAYELRRRGLPVEAYGKTVGSMADKLAFKTQAAWLDAKGYMPEPMTFIRYPISRVDGHLIYSEESEVIKDFLKNTSKVGRYHLYWTWKETECGHIITMETFKDGTRRFYDPQTGKESTTIMPWFKPDGKVLFNVKTHALRAYRVDTLQPNPLIVKGIVKKAGSAGVAPMMTAEQEAWWAKNVEKKTLGGVNGYLSELHNLQKEIKASNRFPVSEKQEFLNVKTRYIENKGKARKFFIDHCRNKEELDAAEFIWNNPQCLEFVKYSKLGEVKDMTNEKAQKNIAKKEKRKVLSYNLYQFDYNNKKWRVKIEVYENCERFYSMVK